MFMAFYGRHQCIKHVIGHPVSKCFLAQGSLPSTKQRKVIVGFFRFKGILIHPRKIPSINSKQVISVDMYANKVKLGIGSLNDNVETPTDLLKQLTCEFKFDFDPCPLDPA